MIFAKIGTPSTYTSLIGHPIWKAALTALIELDDSSPLGITELRGKDMFLNVHTYETLPVSECRFEGHRNMIDVQYIIAGGEYVDWALTTDLESDGEYLINNDFQYYHPPQVPPTTRVHLTPGCFGVFFPDDGHRPQISDGVSSNVYKAVVKIHRELLEEGNVK